MSEKRECREKDLEQVSGGSGDNWEGLQLHFRCPVCGYERWVNVTGHDPIRIDPTCTACRKNGQEVKLKRIF